MNTDQAASFKLTTLSAALTLVADRAVHPLDRALAAAVAEQVLQRLPSNAESTDAVMRALRTSLEVPRAARLLLRVLPRVAVSPETLATPLARMAVDAFERELPALQPLCVAMLAHNAWCLRVDPRWAESVLVRWAQGPTPIDVGPAGELIRALLLRRGVDDWLRPIIRRRPVVVRSHHLTPEQRNALHYAAPTAQSWKYLATVIAGRAALEPWTAERFGGELSVAIETLHDAAADACDTRDGASALLERWLAELAAAT